LSLPTVPTAAAVSFCNDINVSPQTQCKVRHSYATYNHIPCVAQWSAIACVRPAPRGLALLRSPERAVYATSGRSSRTQQYVPDWPGMGARSCQAGVFKA
jgi:hypothetical protein